MTFNELDKRAIEWNQIANGHRSLEERIDTQIDQCNEEMCKEFFYWFGEWNKFNSKHTEDEIKTEILDGFADSRFVFVEFFALESETSNHFAFIHELYQSMLDASRLVFVYYTLLESYRRVIESNFSKFVQSDDMTLEQAILESNVISLAYNCKCAPELINDYWVFRDQNGKIRKPSTFKPVDLSDLI